MSKTPSSKMQRQTNTLLHSISSYKPTGNAEQDAYAKQQLEKELARIERNADRRVAREKLKAKSTGDFANAAAAAASPGPSEADGPTSAVAEGSTPNKVKGRSKDGTARKCANCGQVGHIKTNRKSVSSTFTCSFCHTKNGESSGGDTHGRKKGGAKKKSAGPGGVDGGKVTAKESFAKDSYSKLEL